MIKADPKAIAARRGQLNNNTPEARAAKAEAGRAKKRAEQAQAWRKEHGLS